VIAPSSNDIALDRDLRAVALMNLGIIEAWASATPDAERHPPRGRRLARANDRPYLEVACVAQVAFASRIHPLGVTRRRCQQAMALAERYGWDQEPIVAPALIMLAATMVWTGDFEQADRCLQRTERALRSDAGPGIRLLLHGGTGMLHGGRGRLLDAVAEFGAAEDLRSRLEGSHALANQVTGWLLATQARLGGSVKPGLLWHHSMPIGRARESSATPGR
jgi:LuxR family transcriptional regulator, maltose regulon positive regulatory protein